MLPRTPVHRIVLEHFQSITEHISSSPYNYHLYLHRAHVFAHWGLDGLAVGDAYKALLLIDELEDETGEYHQQVLEQAKPLTEEQYKIYRDTVHQSLPSWLLEHSDSSLNWAGMEGSKNIAYRLLVYILTNIGCLRSAWDFYNQLTTTNSNKHHPSLRDHLLSEIRSSHNLTGVPLENLKVRPEELPDRGFVHRVLYPWNQWEPQRYSNNNLEALNAELFKIAPKLRAEITELRTLSADEEVRFEKQLGLVAADTIAPGEEILTEISCLTANNRLYEPVCDACSGDLPKTELGETVFSCPECDDTLFCSQSCLDGAMANYHPAVCGNDADTIAKEPPPGEAADALYFLLVGRALALSKQQDVHPLDLREVKFLWGEFVLPDFETSPSGSGGFVDPGSTFKIKPTLPFSFRYNVLLPIRYLESMGVDVFAASREFDFWIFETLFAKFRGVASGKVSSKGIPEVSAVHPLWCLANHSCTPNVKWEWSGAMKFWARKEDELVSWGADHSSRGPEGWIGIKQGEKILSHYCDVNLDVKQRREWAHGALGGDCKCARCIWESGESERPKVILNQV